MKKKSDIVLVIITIFLVFILIVGFVYDRNSALLARTNQISINGDDNLELVKMNKAGFLFARAGYEAKIKIKDGNSENYIILIAATYGAAGQMFDYEQYKQYEADVLDRVSLKPDPVADSFVWVLGTTIDDYSNQNIVYIVSLDNDGQAYIYLYYSRR